MLVARDGITGIGGGGRRALLAHRISPVGIGGVFV
jgi:hypothetical protein